MDGEAFNRMMLEQKDRIHGYAAMLLRDRTEAQDVAQEALLRAWRRHERLDERSAVAWLRRTTHNLCIDLIRRRRFHADMDDAAIEASPAPTGGDPERATSAGETGRDVRAALERLPLRDRAVIVMREIQGMSYAEMADVLDVPLGTLKARLHRAREQLREILLRAGVTP